ncbi:cupin domain-containing protein [Methylobacterium brachythecii]|uniref:Transcription regulator HTH AraC- type ligand binding domain-containing protein n=1 Tax=Methylobacterium brachythecii TaxID=1176177 RepID=A0A7W6F9F4_9HYPH|nr:hypothetical protein [Methylobacterium brachythecii]MBB3905467.1 hypothetical protein [Methylobacterium brachythecii]GLS44948.1 hypothetical protein GCM10007884_29370 [Methylobacterium brachythecii]
MTISPLIDLDNLVSPADRTSAWHQTIKDNYFGLDITFKSGRKPAGNIAYARFGEIDISAIESVAQHHARTPPLIADNADRLFAMILLRGSVTVRQSGRERTLHPGSLAIYDSAVPYEADFTDDEHQLFCLQIPRQRCDAVLGAGSHYTNVVLDEERGSTVIAAYFRDLARQFESLSLEHRAQMTACGVEFMIDALAGRLFGLRTSRRTGTSRTPSWTNLAATMM